MKLSAAPFSPNSRLLVAVSGGLDSVALLRLLLDQRGFLFKELSVAHVNYGLRGRDSKLDEEWLRGLCAEWKVGFHCLKPSSFRAKAGKNKKSLQDFARETRYAYFQKWVVRKKAWGVAVAHHREDQAETILDRLLRGTGPRGLSGLRPVQDLSFVRGIPALKVWRPLLSFSREELRAFLKSRGFSWREDKTNQTLAYRRNQIRREILPYLSRWNPRITESLSRLGDVAAAEDQLLDDLLDSAEKALGLQQSSKAVRCEIKKFDQLPLALKRRWVRRAAEKLNGQAKGLSFERVEEVLRLWQGVEPGPRDLGYGLAAGRDKKQLFLSKNN